MSQSEAHIHFAFSTSVTPYKSDTHKHKLITIGWSLLSNLKEARSNLNQDIKNSNVTPFHLIQVLLMAANSEDLKRHSICRFSWSEKSSW